MTLESIDGGWITTDGIITLLRHWSYCSLAPSHWYIWLKNLGIIQYVTSVYVWDLNFEDNNHSMSVLIIKYHVYQAQFAANFSNSL